MSTKQTRKRRRKKRKEEEEAEVCLARNNNSGQRGVLPGLGRLFGGDQRLDFAGKRCGTDRRDRTQRSVRGASKHRARCEKSGNVALANALHENPCSPKPSGHSEFGIETGAGALASSCWASTISLAAAGSNGSRV